MPRSSCRGAGWRPNSIDREVDGRNAGGWVILIAKASPAATSCLAILPVRVRRGEGGGAPRLTMAGRRFADYSGILHRPEARQEAIPALAQCVKRMRWQHWQLEFLRCAPEALRLLLGSFSRHRLLRGRDKGNQQGGGRGQLHLSLRRPAESWDEYLASRSFAGSCAGGATAVRSWPTLSCFLHKCILIRCRGPRRRRLHG